jgi:hypothetical protein
MLLAASTQMAEGLAFTLLLVVKVEMSLINLVDRRTLRLFNIHVSLISLLTY